MPTSFAALPRSRPRKASGYERSAHVLGWVVYLTFGFMARLWLLGFWIFWDRLRDAFDGWVIPLVGFILLPWTTLAYCVMWLIGADKVSGWEWIVVAIALLADVTFWAWSRRAFL